MPADAVDDDRRVRRNFIEIVPGKRPRSGKESVVITDADDDIAGFFKTHSTRGDNLGGRPGGAQRQAAFLQSVFEKVKMRIVKARQHKPAFQIDFFRGGVAL